MLDGYWKRILRKIQISSRSVLLAERYVSSSYPGDKRLTNVDRAIHWIAIPDTRSKPACSRTQGRDLRSAAKEDRRRQGGKERCLFPPHRSNGNPLPHLSIHDRSSLPRWRSLWHRLLRDQKRPILSQGHLSSVRIRNSQSQPRRTMTHTTAVLFYFPINKIS